MKKKVIKIISLWLVGSLFMGMTIPTDYKNTVERKVERAKIEGYLIAEGFIYEDGMIIDYIGENPEVTIPTTLGGETITTIGYNTFKDNKLIRKVTIPESMSIQILSNNKAEVFSGCVNLESVILPSNMTSIPAYVL